MNTEPPFDENLLAKTRTLKECFGQINWDGLVLRVISKEVRQQNGNFVVVQAAQDTSSIETSQKAQLTAILFALPLGIVLAGILASFLSRLVVSPVTRLTAAAERISKNPELRERIGDSSQDEMGRLAVAFDTMTERLQESNKKLQQSLDSQRRFTGDAAHELRTPLTSLSLAAENGLHAEADLEEKNRSLKTVLRSALSMQKLTNMLLTLSKLDDSHSQLETKSIRLRTQVESALQSLYATEDQRIDLSELQSTTTVMANSEALVQILVNLIENAMAHTPANGKITLSFFENELKLSDSGEGIPEEHLEHIFDRFYRVDPSRSRIKGGHGLGLAICKSLAVAQAIELKIQSKIGTGTTFFLKFPQKHENS